MSYREDANGGRELDECDRVWKSSRGGATDFQLRLYPRVEGKAAVAGASGREPVIYATREAYGRFLDAPRLRRRPWIRDVWTEPRLPQSEPWTLWQFDASARVAGIPAFVDLNVFQGDRVALQRF